jgi:hypothetical protein
MSERRSCLGVEVPEAGEPRYEALLVLTLAVLADVPAYSQIYNALKMYLYIVAAGKSASLSQ